MKTNIHFRSYLVQFFLERKIFQTNVAEKIDTYISRSIAFFENPARKNVVGRGRPQTIIWCKRIVCWIPKATNADTGCVILIAFPLQQWLHERPSVFRYTYIAYEVSHYNNTTSNVRIKVILGCVRIITVAVEKQ